MGQKSHIMGQMINFMGHEFYGTKKLFLRGTNFMGQRSFCVSKLVGQEECNTKAARQIQS
jgi:hypothetical protein